MARLPKLLLLLLLLLYSVTARATAAGMQQNLTFALVVDRRLPQSAGWLLHSNSSRFGSVTAAAVAVLADHRMESSLQSVNADYVINMMDCPLGAGAAPNASHVLLEAGANCGSRAHQQLVLHNNSWHSAVLQLLRILRVKSVRIEAEATGRWPGRAAQLLQAVSSDLQTVRLSAPDAADSDAVVIAASSDGEKLERSVAAACSSSSSSSSISSTMIVTESDAAGSKCSSSCRVSVSDAESYAAACGSVSELCEFLQLLRAAGTVRRDQQLLIMLLVHKIVQLHESGAAAAGSGVVQQQLRDSLSQRLFVRCELPGGRNGSGWYDGNRLQLQLPSAAAGRHFLVTTLAEAPFAFPGQRNAEGFEENMTGLTIDMLEIISKKLNFTYKLQYPPDLKWGAVNPDGSWNGMVGRVMRGEADFAVGPFTVTAIRQTVIDFSEAYIEDGNGILIKRPGQKNPMFRILWPFRLELWLVLAASVPVTAFCIYLASYLSPFSACNLQPESSISDEVSLPENLWATLGSLLLQGQDFYPAASSGRIMLLAWWCVSVLILACYTADTVGYLSLDIPAASVSSLTDLADQTRVKPLYLAGTNVETLLKEAEEGSVYARVYKLASGIPEVSQTAEALPHLAKDDPPYALIDDKTVLRHYALTDCSWLLLPELFNVASFAWVLPKGAPFKEEINAEIMELKQKGIMGKLVSKWWRSENGCADAKKHVSQSPISLQTVGGAFIIAGCVMGFGVIVLLLELLLHRLFGRSVNRDLAQ